MSTYAHSGGSRQMLLSGPGGFNFTATACIGWMRETGFRDIQLEPLTPDQSMVVGMKPAT